MVAATSRVPHRTFSISIYDSVQALDYGGGSPPRRCSYCASLTRAGTNIRTAAAHLGGMADQLICQCRKRLSRGFEVEARLRDSARSRSCRGALPAHRARERLPAADARRLERPDAGPIRRTRDLLVRLRRGIHLPRKSVRAGFLVSRLRAVFRISRWRRTSATRALAELPTSCSRPSWLAELATSKPRERSRREQQRVPWRARWLPTCPISCWMNRFPRWIAPHARRITLRTAAHAARRRRSQHRSSRTTRGACARRLDGCNCDGRIRQTGPVQECSAAGRFTSGGIAGVENVLAAEIVGRRGAAVLQVGS
jgi:hypothetical protein